jgi:hypothetical protein
MIQGMKGNEFLNSMNHFFKLKCMIPGDSGFSIMNGRGNQNDRIICAASRAVSLMRRLVNFSLADTCRSFGSINPAITFSRRKPEQRLMQLHELILDLITKLLSP